MELLWHIISFVLIWTFLGTNASVFTFQNNCQDTIWPGTLSGSGKPLLNNGGFQLGPAESTTIDAPKGWSGRFWARSGCTFDQSGKGNCTTGDCGNVLQCNGAGGAPPVSLAEFTLDSPQDFYDVSLVDGYNMPISIVPSGGSGNCSEVKCVSDLNKECPQDLVVAGGNGATVACKSACLAFNEPQYCCSGEYNNPQVCKPSNFSQVFKKACPTSYSYPYDDATSTFTCSGANYLITFC
ncbi:pathogenesis-related protein 5-like [Olea europaea var. sylvestris]|uniref:Pathogenesis-related 5-like n=1 Tax=Olea europaea subsp. europaea TaxID=158383 RepID=A0A8S0V8B2_OLEEU|nr:pathogenesis-related protein 5-like [Olea europaea var. sylvestris]CAA3029704.1 pathogenesis-related 5-like [Olea europaea subsp. europaea]